MPPRFDATLDLRVTRQQRDALTWWAKKVGVSVAELVRATLPSSIPSPRGGAEVDAQVEALREAVIEAAIARGPE